MISNSVSNFTYLQPFEIKWSVCLCAAIPEDALNDESDDEDRENPDKRLSSK